jgi:cytochrome c-type biogenesis protein CcmH/NrfG
VLALEKAISLEPDNSQHKINLALVYADLPPENNPMAGIQMLLDMNKKDPQDVEVIVRIGRLAIKTGQYDRAIERLKRALELDPQNKSAPCFLYQAYSGLGDQAKAEEFKARCEQF